jgi:GT2 family glycosyltransferase
MSTVECERSSESARVTHPEPVSAVVCNFNGEQYLPGCLDALLAQDEPPDEIIVVDNGSTDGSVRVIVERYPRVKLVALPYNGGPCVARNAGMRAARNRLVLAVDNDAVPRPDVLGRLRAALVACPGAVAAQPRSVFASETTRVHYDGGRFHYAGLYSLRNFCAPLADAEGEGVLPVDGLIAISPLLDRDRVLALGGYDEDFFILFEDYDLSLRLRIAGLAVLSVEDALVLHRGGTPGISFRGEVYPRIRAFYHSRNRWLLLVKNHRWRTLVVSLPGLCVYELVWTLFTLRSGHIKAHAAGKGGFLKDLGRALDKRRQVQASRRVDDRELLVGGPLTLSPQLVRSAAARAASSVLDALLRAWWSVARPFAG